jgi:hypothetical protein
MNQCLIDPAKLDLEYRPDMVAQATRGGFDDGDGEIPFATNQAGQEASAPSRRWYHAIHNNMIPLRDKKTRAAAPDVLTPDQVVLQREDGTRVLPVACSHAGIIQVSAR